MAIVYNTEDAKETIGGLADALERIAGLDFGEDTEIDFSNSTELRQHVGNIIEAFPDANPIREGFDKAIELAQVAGDQKIEDGLRDRYNKLVSTHEQLVRQDVSRQEYNRLLKGVASWIRGVLCDITGEEVKTATDDAAQMRELLRGYAVELANETPVLCRFTNCTPVPVAFDCNAERKKDRAYRDAVILPKDKSTLAMCMDHLNNLLGRSDTFNAVCHELRQNGCNEIADNLTTRRTRRAADIDRMKSEAAKIAPAFCAPSKFRRYDFGAWETAAQSFNAGIVDDVAYIQIVVADQLVAAYADYNDRLLRAGGKPFLKATAKLTLPPDVSQKGAKAILEMLNNQVGIIPPAKFDKMTVFKIIDAFERRYKELADIHNIYTGGISELAEEIRNGFADLKSGQEEIAKGTKGNGVKLDALNAKTDDVLDEMKEWQEYIRQLVAGYDGNQLETPPLSFQKMQAISQVWESHKKECAGKNRATYQDCLDKHGSEVIYKGYQLLQLVPTETVFSKLIHNMKEQAAKNEGKRKSKTQSRRNAK